MQAKKKLKVNIEAIIYLTNIVKVINRKMSTTANNVTKDNVEKAKFVYSEDLQESYWIMKGNLFSFFGFSRSLDQIERGNRKGFHLILE